MLLAAPTFLSKNEFSFVTLAEQTVDEWEEYESIQRLPQVDTNIFSFERHIPSSLCRLSKFVNKFRELYCNTNRSTIYPFQARMTFLQNRQISRREGGFRWQVVSSCVLDCGILRRLISLSTTRRVGLKSGSCEKGTPGSRGLIAKSIVNYYDNAARFVEVTCEQPSAAFPLFADCRKLMRMIPIL